MKQIVLAMLAVAAMGLVACRAPLSDKLVSEAGHSGDDHRTLDYRVYLPPGYEKDTERRYPLLVWFHGGGENENGWGRVGKIGEIVQQREEKGELQPFIVLSPSAGAFTPIWFGYEKRFIEDTLPTVQKKYRTNGTVVGFGHSMGGLTALMLVTRQPELFDGMCVASPFIYDTSAWESEERRKWFEDKFGTGGYVGRYRQNQRTYFDTEKDFRKWDPYSLLREKGAHIKLPPILLTCGDQDSLGLWPHTLHLHEVLAECGVAHDWLVQPGVGHGTVEDPRVMAWLNTRAKSAERTH